MTEVLLVLGGFFLGLGVWFPWKHYLRKALKKKREATSMLVELGMNEREHAQTMDPTKDYSKVNMPWSTTATTTTNVGNWKPSKHWTAGPNNTYRSFNRLEEEYRAALNRSVAAQSLNSTAAPLSASSTSLDARYCTQCNGLVGSESHSCSQGTNAL